jgi:hypothetical protein
VFIFLVCCTRKVKKGKILKTLRQNNAVVRRAALLERKQRLTELARGCLASRICCSRKKLGGTRLFL